MITIGPVDWAIILWSSVSRGLLAGVVGRKPMVPTNLRAMKKDLKLMEGN